MPDHRGPGPHVRQRRVRVSGRALLRGAEGSGGSRAERRGGKDVGQLGPPQVHAVQVGGASLRQLVSTCSDMLCSRLGCAVWWCEQSTLSPRVASRKKHTTAANVPPPTRARVSLLTCRRIVCPVRTGRWLRSGTSGCGAQQAALRCCCTLRTCGWTAGCRAPAAETRGASGEEGRRRCKQMQGRRLWWLGEGCGPWERTQEERGHGGAWEHRRPLWTRETGSPHRCWHRARVRWSSVAGAGGAKCVRV